MNRIPVLTTQFAVSTYAVSVTVSRNTTAITGCPEGLRGLSATAAAVIENSKKRTLRVLLFEAYTSSKINYNLSFTKKHIVHPLQRPGGS
jgi:hypothetical protein